VSDLDLVEAIERARTIAKQVGVFQMQSRGTAAIEFKGPIELVTEVDRQSEERIVSRLLEFYPDHDVFAEEKWVKEERKSAYRWIVDPIDGTTNYAHGLPIFAISIGLEKRAPDQDSGEIVGGVIHAPALGETFHAVKGHGAFLNDNPISVTKTEKLDQGVFATGFAYVRHKSANDNLDNWAHLAMITRDLRRLGSAAIDMAYVAAGRFDGFWEYHLEPYDVAAGAILIKEAGGKVTDTEGGDRWLFGRRIVATNGLLHEPLRNELKPVRADEFIPL
jgi:myo-inositol-1(or 4)-monophosphatase